jgi:transposase-like protein
MIIDRYRRRESSVEEALIEMYLAGVPVRVLPQFRC